MKASRNSFGLVVLLLLASLTIPDKVSGGLFDVEPERTGQTFAINVPRRELNPNELSSTGKLTLERAVTIARKYRWIYINASLKNLEEAKEEAKLLSNDFGGKPLVLVYLARAPFVGGRNVYPEDFLDTMRSLLRRVPNGQTLLVSAKSYGVHQTLRAINRFADDGSLILFAGISPAFGAFGGMFSWDTNVGNYRDDVRNTSCNYCMIALSRDVHTTATGGAAWRRSDGRIEGDPEVLRAMEHNRDNVTTIVLHGSPPPWLPSLWHPMRQYVDHGLANAMRQCAEHFGLKDTLAGNVLFKPPQDEPDYSVRIVGPSDGSSFDVYPNTSTITTIRVLMNRPGYRTGDYTAVNFFLNDKPLGFVRTEDVSYHRTGGEYRFNLRPSHLPPSGPGRDEVTHQIIASGAHMSGQRVGLGINVTIRDHRPYVFFDKPESSSAITYRDYHIVDIGANVANLDPTGIEKVRFYVDGRQKTDDMKPPYSGENVGKWGRS